MRRTNVKLLAIITSFAAGPAERLLDCMFHDDRVFMHAADYRGQLDEEVDRLLDIPDYTWTRLVAMIGPEVDIGRLMHLAFKGAFISYGYLWSHIFKQLLDGLLKLTQGDLEQNLTNLFAVGDPGTLHPELRKVWRCYHVHGISMAYLELCVRLLKEICATSNLVEQGHGTGAVIMKLHQQLGESMLRAWSMVHSCRGMYSKSKLDKTLDRHQKNIEKLGLNSIALRGINIFAQEHKTRIQIELQAAGHTGASISKHWMRLAQDSYQVLSDHERARYVMKAAAATNERRAIAIGEVDSLRNLSKLAMLRHADDIAKHGFPNHVSSCKFTTSDYDSMRAIYDSLDSSGMGRLADLKKFDAPAELPTDEVKRLEDLAARLMPVADVPRPMWLGRMCIFRVSFEET
jgi:hypothetical protein